MKLYTKMIAICTLAAALAGCTDSNSDKEAQELQLKMDETTFALKQWKVDGSHSNHISGTFMQGEKPVVNAVLQVGKNKRSIETGDDGSFQILLDQSLLGETPVQVVSLDHATIGGKPLSKNQSDIDKVAPLSLNVYYPIEILSTAVSTQDPKQTEIKGRLVADKTASVAFFQEDKFRISGIVKDSSGVPVQGAIVWIDRDTGEGFAKSSPTDENGYYSMFYLPEEDEDTNLTVDYNSVKYTLPENKVFHFPEDTSLNVDITLPSEGSVIDDKPPTLVSHTAPGALYLGLLVGLDVAEDVNYTVTIPDAAGNFSITVPTKVWEQNPTFFETNMSKFIEKDELQAGDSLPSSFIEMTADAPRNIKGELK
ncbi:carboxypeptidase-like regulatory domain-containing protein [Cohnella mopanensis]|uniref:carboxypeptidase-like regulatory domain-containing protein n=1 Tax=Cohnella mopanensis TaxID=2911966 RepID=UPI001EF82AE9|nr:carboxypeptidase-like regulatory domain-containing protein [Cohnella mopanensis]